MLELGNFCLGQTGCCCLGNGGRANRPRVYNNPRGFRKRWRNPRVQSENRSGVSDVKGSQSNPAREVGVLKGRRQNPKMAPCVTAQVDSGTDVLTAFKHVT